MDPRLMAEGRRTRGALYGSIYLGVAAGLLIIVQAVLLAQVINRVAFRHESVAQVTFLLWLVFGLFFVRAGLSWAAEIVAFRASGRIKTYLRQVLLARILRLGPVHAAGEQSADLAGVMIEGVEALEPYFSRYVPQMALVVAVPLAILTLVFPTDWISGIILLVTGPLVPFFMVYIGYKAEAINQRQWQKLLLLSTHFLDVLQGLTTLKLFGRARDEIQIATQISDDYRKTTMAAMRIAFLTSAALEFFASLAIALVAVLFGARLIHGHITFYPAFLVLLLAPEYFVPLRGLSVHYHARMTAIAAARRIFAILDLPVGEVPAGGAPEFEAIALECAAVECAYAEGPPVLQGMTCRFEAGKITAIVGASGAGKTTLARLLLGFVRPTRGAVTINGAVDLADIPPEAWWQNLAWVPQNPRLFQGSIAANIRLGRPDADLASLREAAAHARALEFIEALPQGFETVIGDLGQGLSGGQIQRIALARAFLKDPQLLILDEATANLDLESEALVLEAIADLTRGRTVILIAHRLALAERADQILVLDEGKVVESGTPEALLAAEGPYRALSRAYYGEVAPCAI
ncbi:MAG: thiol reductant ABC exporter subunit CydD [Acidocella sp. 20-63-7]|nr:MAG: thiol reductant ABC exporter subunit CydD [Acidocella sp. 20-63-7]